MTLGSKDELRHPHNSDPNWRESVYFNFDDERNGIGGWIYYWVTPNQEKRTGMLVCFYHGAHPDRSVGARAFGEPAHLLQSGDDWLYFYNHDGDALEPADFDDVDFHGLKLRRTEPLKRYALSFHDDANASFDIDCQFLTPPYDYADGLHPTPSFIADNRYHRAWKATGSITIGGRTYEVDCWGDSDHSWGRRDRVEFGANLFKMWSFRTLDGRLMISVLKQGIEGAASGRSIALGFVSLDGEMCSAASVETSASYDQDGVQHGITLEITDIRDRTVRARLDRMHSFLGFGQAFWGYEGVGVFQVDGFGAAPGLSSYFWPEHVTPAMLHAGEMP